MESTQITSKTVCEVRKQGRMCAVAYFYSGGFSLGYYYIIGGVSGHEILTKALRDTTQWIHKQN